MIDFVLSWIFGICVLVGGVVIILLCLLLLIKVAAFALNEWRSLARDWHRL